MAIIKCPECNHEVSDQAAHCPFCGIDIAGNLVTCPDCGKILLKSVKTCPNCGCNLGGTIISQNSVNSNHTQPSGETPTSGTPNNKKKKIWIIVIIFVVLIVGFGGYSYLNHKSQTDNMETEYQNLEKDNNTADYEAFLEKYPQSQYTKEVRNRLDHLKLIQNQWTEISMSSSRNDFASFMQQFPNSQYESACKVKIDSLDWIDASSENTPDAYQRYLTMHPDGKYVNLCNQSKTNLDKMTVSYDEKSSVRGVVIRYFETVTQNDQDGLSQIVVDKMYEQSLNFMTQIHSGTAQTSFQVKGPINTAKTPAQNEDQFNFIAKFRVEKQTVENGTTTSILYNASSFISPDMRIVSIKLNKVPSAE